MKKQLNNIILSTLLITASLMTFSCKGMTEWVTNPTDKNEQNNFVYAEKKPLEAMSYVGKINKTFDPINENGKYATNELNDYKGTGVTARVETKLVEYNSLSREIRDYIEKINSTGARHKTYNNLQCNKSMDYVEFTSYIDIRNGNVMEYDLTFFDESINTLSKLGKKLFLSPDMEIDTVRMKYIKTGARAPRYKYPYAVK